MLVVCAPFGMSMTHWESYSGVVITALGIGGFPLLCVSSILLSRYLLWYGDESLAFVFAIVPLFIGVASLTLAFLMA